MDKLGWLGDTLLSGRKEVPTKDALSGVKTLGIYFSASWCIPCKKFTPLMQAVYEAKKEANEGFEIVFVHRDREKKHFEDYYATMPWLAVPYDKAVKIGKDIQLALKTKVSSIPTLLIVDPKLGILIEKEGRARIHEYQQELAMKGDKRQLTSHDAVKRLQKGIPMSFYMLNQVKGVEIRQVILKYTLESKGSQGALVWTEINNSSDTFKKDCSGKLDLSEIDGISMGKSGIILKSPGGGGVASSQCFSLNAGPKTVAGHVGSLEEAQCVFDTVSHVLGCGKDRLSQDKKLASDGSVKNPVVGFRVIRWTTEMEEMEKKRKQLQKGPPPVDVKKLVDNKDVKALSKGVNIMAYQLDDMQLPKAQKMCLVYKAKKAGRLGTLFWCDRRKKRRPPVDCGKLELEDLVSISLGKQTRILQTSAATMAEAEGCMSLIGPSGQLSIEAEEGENDVDLIIRAIQHIIQLSKDKKMSKVSEGHGKFEKVALK
ncbi:hypothetical protein AAMO2058_000232700 [Amorphochlora amoebiformis]